MYSPSLLQSSPTPKLSIFISSSSKIPSLHSQKSPPSLESPSKIPSLHSQKSPPSSLKSPSKSLLSHPLDSKNPHSIHRHLRRLAHRNRLSDALSVLHHLDQRGVPVNASTFAALLAAASRLKSLPSIRQLHVHIRINALEDNEYLLTKLVQAYTSCNAPDEAKDLFFRLQTGTVYPWNALLKGNVVSGGPKWGHGPLTVFSTMREFGVEANEYTFSCLLKSLAGSAAFVNGMKVHTLLVKNGLLDAYVHLQTTLVDLYFKCRKVRLALKVFDEITERDVVVWGAVVAGLVHNGMKREALEALRWMGSEGVKANSVIVTSILPMIGELPSGRDLGREIHAFVLKRFTFYNELVFIHSGLIDMYSKCGDLISARRVFYGSKERNAVSWTALMSGYASNGRFEQALRSIVWMQQEGIRPDVVSIATALPVCVQLKALNRGKEIHAYAIKHRYFPNVSLSTSLMTMYTKCGELEYARRVFDNITYKNSVLAWTALIDSYLKTGYPYVALDIFRSMLLTDQRPDAVALSRILNTCTEIAAVKLGKEIHGQVLKMKFDVNPFVTAEMVRMYGKCRDVESARKVFDGVQSKGSLTCTAIIEAYGYNSHHKEALDLFDWMLLNGFSPNHFTFDITLNICEEAGMHERALKIFRTMVREYGIKASEEQYNCIIRILNHLGLTVEAQNFTNLRSLIQ